MRTHTHITFGEAHGKLYWNFCLLVKVLQDPCLFSEASTLDRRDPPSLAFVSLAPNLLKNGFEGTTRLLLKI